MLLHTIARKGVVYWDGVMIIVTNSHNFSPMIIDTNIDDVDNHHLTTPIMINCIPMRGKALHIGFFTPGILCSSGGNK